MIGAKILGWTRELGKSQGYIGLTIRDIVYDDGTQAMQSAWTPTPAELERLNAGANIILTVLGTGHPPVKVEVAD